MPSKLKPLLIEVSNFSFYIGNVLQIARAEAEKVLKCEKVKVLDIIKY